MVPNWSGGIVVWMLVNGKACGQGTQDSEQRPIILA